MKWLALGAFLLPFAGAGFAGAGQAACPDGSLMQNAARGWIAGQRLPDPQVRTLEDGLCAYATFRSVLEAELGAPVGVKVGFTSKPAQEKFGIEAPVAGALFAPMLLPDGARVSMAGSRTPFYEADLIVTVGDAAIMQAKTREEAAAALKDLRPFVELPDLALQKGVTPTGPLMAAYGVTPWRGVLGRGIAIADLKDPISDLAGLTVSLRVDGKTVDSAQADMLLEHPLDVVLWLVEHGGYDLKPGSVISLGSLGSLHPAQAGQRVAAVYRVGGKIMHVDLSLVP
ncbi:MAG: fumarylacetoacetate hydrolase family protein [Paracoccus sp.]|jgi:2-oxo-hept-3-ene-1,7-dioate hydratase|nr:fumarylacetoacetate hydrolase family protein [Paracoccus sp. (in: a-proteobacteria)]